MLRAGPETLRCGSEAESASSMAAVVPRGGTFEVASTSGSTPAQHGMLLCSLRSASSHKPGRRRYVLTASFSEATLQRGDGGQVPWQIGIPVVLGVKKGMKGLVMRFPENARRFLAGAFAGALSKTATAPLETIRMQMMTGDKSSFGQIIARTYQNGGMLAFFNGNNADVLRTMPSKAIELASFDLYKRLLSHRDGHSKQLHRPGGLATGLAGAMAGITSTIALFPMETVRTRMAVRHKQYRGIADAFRSIVATEGFPALYRGLNASLLGVIPYAAVRLGMYDGLKWAHKQSTGKDAPPPGVTMAFGALAAVASASAAFPLEVVRRRAMVGTAPHANTLAAMTLIARNEGVGALYKGVFLTWLKQAPQYAVTFLAYDLAKAWLAVNGAGAKGSATKAAGDSVPAAAGAGAAVKTGFRGAHHGAEAAA